MCAALDAKAHPTDDLGVKQCSRSKARRGGVRVSFGKFLNGGERNTCKFSWFVFCVESRNRVMGDDVVDGADESVRERSDCVTV